MEPPRKSPRPSRPVPDRPRHHRAEAEPDRPGLAARRAASRLLAAVIDTKTSADGLTDRRHGHADFLKLDTRDQGLVKAILLTSLRHRGTITAIVEACLDRPLPGKAASLRHILHTGAAQVLFLDVPDSAAVDLAVAQAASDSRTERFASLVNAILRRIGREKEAMLARFDDPQLDCPDWLFERLVAGYGMEQALAIAQMHRLPAPLDITAKGDPAEVAAQLGGTVLPFGTVRLGGGEGAVSEMPGFTEGTWWVQDAAASLPARLFGDIAGLRVADLCAAPGGKTAQLAAMGAKVTALDISASRMRRLRENLGRLGLEAEFTVTDLAGFEPAEPFDGVLLDAPCSSTGTIRRHPDVAYTKDPGEIAKLAGVQARMLASAADLVKPGGLLVFSNCSLDREEGEEMVAGFLRDRPDFAIEPVRPDELPGLEQAISAEGTLRTTPAMLVRETPDASGLDGFFAARLRRAA
ncbi:RsmB/NOP family class I SAM-dependent RNA methyltransferase [Aureimonas sp. AU12]|uniref:RsmB/NOP family class I SAM-dependent RNA methyltransferase n=1 Tax=Aureimonas sp. AU12 TaxID=1638161 RepID=UPI000782023F|nr:RsmB/NOP family class I SAM-dependent RNA methyltransferase [Aureimonas sp. AU12]